MEEKMTSGEIAKKTGISQKAIRLYDEKGLLKPTGYTKGKYRLYDKEALLVLEKIIALKQVGFSLEEIKENLSCENGMEIRTALEHQIEMMDRKRQQLEKSIACIQRALNRCMDAPDWDSIAEILRLIQIDQKADDAHFQALRHEADNEDWYVKIYHSLNIQAGERVMDIGCGYGKLWRNNWDKIPENITVSAIDIHGSWADDFEVYALKHASELAAETRLEFCWKDVEKEETWQELKHRKPYNRIIAHYLFGFLQDKEKLIAYAKSCLAEDGIFCCNGAGGNKKYLFWKELFEKLELPSDFVLAKIAEKEKNTEVFLEMLKKYFSQIKEIQILNHMCYGDSEELLELLKVDFPEQKKFFSVYEEKLRAYFKAEIAENNGITIETNALFWQCRVM